MIRFCTLLMVAGLLAGELAAQAEKNDEKTSPEAQAAEIARLRQQVEQLKAENAKLKAEAAKPRATGAIGRLVAAEPRVAQAAVLALAADAKVKVPARFKWKAGVVAKPVPRVFEGRFTWAGAQRIAYDNRYEKLLPKVNDARDRLSHARDDDAALRAIDEMSKALMEVRAELWKRVDAAKKKAAEKK